MAIARAIERITQRAQQGGIVAVLTGLGEELRGEAIPTPLRNVARRLATLLDGRRPALDTGESRGHAEAPAIMVNVAVAVAVSAEPVEPSAASAASAKPVVATAVAMSPNATGASSDDAASEQQPDDTDDADDPESAGEAAWRSGLAPRA